MKKAIESNPDQVRLSLFEKHYSKDPHAIDFFNNYQLADGKLLPNEVINEYALNAAVLNTVDRIYKERYELRKSLHGPVNDLWTIVTNECNRFRDVQPHTLPSTSANLKLRLMDYKNRGYEALIHGNLRRQVTSCTLGSRTMINDFNGSIGKDIHVRTNAPQGFSESNNLAGIVGLPDLDFAVKNVAHSRGLILSE